MKTTLLDLWYGNLSPWNESAYRKEETAAAIHLIERQKEKLLSTISNEEKEIAAKIEQCQVELTCLEREDAFLRGFCLAIKIMTESISD